MERLDHDFTRFLIHFSGSLWGRHFVHYQVALLQDEEKETKKTKKTKKDLPCTAGPALTKLSIEG